MNTRKGYVDNKCFWKSEQMLSWLALLRLFYKRSHFSKDAFEIWADSELVSAATLLFTFMCSALISPTDQCTEAETNGILSPSLGISLFLAYLQCGPHPCTPPAAIRDWNSFHHDWNWLEFFPILSTHCLPLIPQDVIRSRFPHDLTIDFFICTGR